MSLTSTILVAPAWTRHDPPARQPATLDRPRLVRLIDDVVAQHPVTVVTAPSGFGKTTAVSGWSEETPTQVAWLGLDPLEDESGTVDDAIIAALESVLPPESIGAVEPLSLPPAGEPDARPVDLLRRVEEALAGVFEPFVLIIDDAQRARQSLASGLLAGLVARTPPALRIILVGTTALELAMPRFVLSNPAAVIGAEALAFDAHEVDELAVQMSSQADAAAVHADTAGWPIAVRLALLSRSSSRPAAATRGTGVMREYVRDVILSALDPELARFVVEAAVCDHLTPRLAVELTDRTDAAKCLEECRRLGLFLDRHDGRAGAEYRWHALFARHCRELLAEEQPERLAELHRRAAILLAEARPLDAVAHHLAVEDPRSAVRVILDSWVGLVVRSSAAALDGVCLSLPGGWADGCAIQLIRACARDVIGEHSSARDLFDRAAAVATGDEDEQRTLELARLFFTDERARVAPAIAAVRSRLAAFGAPVTEHAAITFLLGWTELRQRSNPEVIVETLESAVREAEGIGDRALARRARECLAYALSWAGELTAARARLDVLADEEPDESSWGAYVGGSGAVAAGNVALWANDLARAEQEFRRVIAFGGSRRTFADLSRVLLAAVAAATGDPRQCRRAALELQFLPRTEERGVSWPAFRQIAVALLEEAVGHEDRAIQLARTLADESGMPIVAVFTAGILRRAGAYTEALQVLRRPAAFAAVSYMRVATLATTALSHWVGGHADAAHELIEEALAVAEAEIIRLPFSERDPELRELLSAHVAWGTAHEEFLLSCLRPGPGSALSALSERERDVFEQLRTTLTTIEIAERLGVSVNTVKTHQRSIYRKLAVTSRREALRQYT